MAIITYPRDLGERIGEGFPHISFELIDTSVPDFTKIHLYIPDGINSSDGASYGSLDLGVINSLKDITSKADADKKFASNTNDALLVGLKAAEKFGVDSQLTSATAQSKGIAFNPQTALAFQNMNMRSFSFEFKLVPESPDDSETIRSIENLFRKYMYASKAGIYTLKYPPKWRIKYNVGEQENKYLPFMHDCYLSSFDALHNGDGNSFFANGAPTSTGIKLSFVETKMLTREDLYPENGYDYTYQRATYVSPSTSGEQ